MSSLWAWWVKWWPPVAIVGVLAIPAAVVVAHFATTERRCGTIAEVGGCSNGAWNSSGTCRVRMDSGERRTVRNPTMVGDEVCWREAIGGDDD